MKKAICLVVSIFCVLASCFSAHGVDLDGINRSEEWDGATTYRLFSGESNSSVEFGAVTVKFAHEEYAVYLCFSFVDPKLEADNMLAGISLSVENSQEYALTMANNAVLIGDDKHEISGAMHIDENGGGVCEVRLAIKNGIPKETKCAVRFLDYQGVPSNVYYFTLVNEEYEEITQPVIRPTADNSDPGYNPDLLTTKPPKTTKEKTTKETTTKSTTTEKPQKTTTRKAKTTQKKENETEKAVTVYYYEKEIIVSQVIITQQVSEKETPAEEITTSEVIQGYTQPVTEIPLSDGSKYKTIAGLVGAIVVVAVAAWGAVGTKGKKTEDEQMKDITDETK